MRLVTPASYVYGNLDGWTVVHGILQVGTATRAPLHTQSWVGFESSPSIDLTRGKYLIS